MPATGQTFLDAVKAVIYITPKLNGPRTGIACHRKGREWPVTGQE
jgi:hypothetical protein